ncbi:ABC1 family [Nesidiocoris tenuis]|uniref:ABC1 family n=2 Tax=Nesidiocoris tenuis TaxID=355587 RepID=A0ABN7ANB5_9HEMI|nr:ABC1 family [Nesidiocoris tenuis]
MLGLRAGRLAKYLAVGAVAVTSAVSYRANGQQIENIGIVRFARAGITAAQVVWMYKTTIYSTNLDSKSDEYLELRSKVHTSAAQKLLNLCETNKGVFVKIGQHLGGLDYILPYEYVEVLKILHSRAPTSPLEDVLLVLRQDLKQDPSEIFIDFDPIPLGTASLAQVHKAKLKSGETVAVKIQHPFVKGNSLVDMKTMELFVKIASWIFPEFRFDWLVTESKKNIARELDFEEEALTTINAKRLFNHLKWLKIPSVYTELSSSRVITLEFVDGGQVNDLAYMQRNGIDRFEVSDKLGKLYSEMIFRKGYVHSDPHPGNILVRKTPSGTAEIVLLDHGLYQTLTDTIKEEYSSLWLSILSRDIKGIERHGEALGVGRYAGLLACMVSGRSWDAINSGIVVTSQDSAEKKLISDSFSMFFAAMTETLQRMNPELLLILKTNDLLRGIEFRLRTQHRMSSYLVMSRACIRTVYDQRIQRGTSSIRKLGLYLTRQWMLFQLIRKMKASHEKLGLVKLSKYEVLEMKIVSMFLGIWFLIKRTFKKLIGYHSSPRSIEKQPSCLTDSSMGVHSYIKLKGVKLHYLDAGNKNSQLVVLLHGFPDCWLSWRYQIGELSKYYRVIALDLKGFGDSDKPEASQNYNIEAVAREIRDLVSTLGYKRCILIGHDLGALVGWFVMHFYEDMVIKFVSVSAPHPNHYWKAFSNSTTLDTRWVQFCQLPYLPEAMALDEDMKMLDEAFPHLKTLPGGESVLAAYKYAFSRTEDWTGAINYFRIWPFWRLKVVQNYSANSLFVVGNKDSNTIMESIIKSTDYVDKFAVKLIENAGHYPHQEKPDEFNQLLINFLVGMSAASPEKQENVNGGLVNRMFGAVSSTVKYGTGVIDVVHKKTNGFTSRALSFGQYC